MVITSFKPSQNGFHFPNLFVNHLLDVPGLGAITTRGRCGGMAYASLDYYFAGIPIPPYLPSDFPGGQVPPDGNPLADYIYARLLNSFTDGGFQFVQWTLLPDNDTPLFRGVTRLTRGEISKLRTRIDAGRPAPIGLVVAASLAELGNDHQVVAYGYDYDATSQKTTIYLYDNNYPDRDDAVLVADPAKPHLDELVGSDVVASWRGMFIQNYRRKTPPTIGA
ncbi:MAG: hypothetical protein Q7R39_06040 [Dehalococcoidia bacterium]|nr:hypothetical protein [Dehalococcoidia bacterium]